MAQEMRNALQIADRMYTQYEESRVRLWYPRISLAWLGVAQSYVIADSGDAAVQMQAAVPRTGWETPNDGEANLTLAETAEGLLERGYSLSKPVIGNRSLPGGLSFSILGAKERAAKKWTFSIPDVMAWLWSQSWMLRLRLRLARGYRSLSHSPHLRHAMKNAIGVAVLSLPAFLPSTNSGKSQRSCMVLLGSSKPTSPRLVLVLAWRVDGDQVSMRMLVRRVAHVTTAMFGYWKRVLGRRGVWVICVWYVYFQQES